MRIVILGAGLGGLAAGLRLGRSGHQVTIVDHDPVPPQHAEHAFADWQRPSVTQWRQYHVFRRELASSWNARCPTFWSGWLKSEPLHDTAMSSRGCRSAGQFSVVPRREVDRCSSSRRPRRDGDWFVTLRRTAAPRHWCARRGRRHDRGRSGHRCGRAAISCWRLDLFSRLRPTPFYRGCRAGSPTTPATTRPCGVRTRRCYATAESS